MGITLPDLTPAQESLFLTLGGRALDNRLASPFLGDTMALEAIEETGYDLARFPSLLDERLDLRYRVFDIAVRAKRLDEVVRRFVDLHNDAVVLDLGAGLDSRVFRVDPPPTVDWYDIDFPEVIALRQQVLPQRAGAHVIGADLTDAAWLSTIPSDRPAVIVADGLLAFLTRDGLISLLNRLVGHFPGGELATNSYTTYAVRAAKRLRSMAVIAGGVVNPGFNDPREPERWVPGLELVDEILLTRAPEVAQFPRVARWSIARLVAPSRRLSRTIGTTVLHYRF